MKHLMLVLLLLLCKPAHADLAGICVVDTPGKPLATSPDVRTALNLSYVDCAAILGQSWASIETADGVYDWSAVDAEVAIIKAAGKTYSLGFQAGNYIPGWLVMEDAASTFATMDEGIHVGTFCTPLTIANPLNATFQAKWTAFVVAAGAHFALDPALQVVKISGINLNTDETLLPFGSGQTVNGCAEPNDVANWQSIGYTQASIDATFNTILNAYVGAFPGKQFAVMTGITALPSIYPGAESLSSTDFFVAARAKLGMNFIAQTNSIKGGTPQPMGRILDAICSGFPAAWQLSQPVTNDVSPSCFMNLGVSPCPHLATMQQVIINAFPQCGGHPKYIENFAADLNNPELAGVWVDEQTRLKKPLIGSAGAVGH